MVSGRDEVEVTGAYNVGQICVQNGFSFCANYESGEAYQAQIQNGKTEIGVSFWATNRYGFRTSKIAVSRHPGGND
jgi:hypothetical protein